MSMFFSFLGGVEFGVIFLNLDNGFEFGALGNGRRF